MNGEGGLINTQPLTEPVEYQGALYSNFALTVILRGSVTADRISRATRGTKIGSFVSTIYFFFMYGGYLKAPVKYSIGDEMNDANQGFKLKATKNPNTGNRKPNVGELSPHVSGDQQLQQHQQQ